MKLSKLITGLALVAGLAVPVSGGARAEGTAVSVWGGYFHTLAPEVEGFSNGAVPGRPPLFNHFTPDADDGGFFGASVSVPLDPGALLFGNVELYFEGQVTERDKGTDTSVNFGFIPLADGFVATFGDTSALSARLERERYEFGANLSLPARPGGLLPFGLVVTPFGGFATEDAQSRVSRGVAFSQTNSDIDWWFLGVLVGTEYTLPLGVGFDLVVGGAGGIYAYDADADFDTTSNVGAARSASDTDSDVGFRARASVALRTTLGEGVQVSVFGGLDYWSDLPYSKLPDPSAFVPQQSPAHIATDDVLDLKAGIRLTMFLDGLM